MTAFRLPHLEKISPCPIKDEEGVPAFETPDVMGADIFAKLVPLVRRRVIFMML